jgi:uncharacterized membrane protein
MKTIVFSLLVALGGAAMPSPRIIPILPPQGYTGTSAADVSADGSIVVGNMGRSDGAIHGYRWTEATGAVRVEGEGAEITGMSDDGTVMAGVVRINGRQQGAIWDAQGRLTMREDLGYIYNVTGSGQILAGKVNAGYVLIERDGTEVSLGTTKPAEGNFDGSIIVGGGRDAAVWRRSTGWVRITSMDDRNAIANALSSDGSLIGGSFRKIPPFGGPRPFLWTAERGAWQVDEWGEIRAISADGQTVLADGWIAHAGGPKLPYREYYATLVDLSGWEGVFSGGRVSPDARKIVSFSNYRGVRVGYLFIDDRQRPVKAGAHGDWPRKAVP